MLDIDAVGAVDWVVVAAARSIVRLFDRAYADRCLQGPELSSGWRGNVVFLVFWAIVTGGVVAILI